MHPFRSNYTTNSSVLPCSLEELVAPKILRILVAHFFEILCEFLKAFVILFFSNLISEYMLIFNFFDYLPFSQHPL